MGDCLYTPTDRIKSVDRSVYQYRPTRNVYIHLTYEYEYQNAKQFFFKTTIHVTVPFAFIVRLRFSFLSNIYKKQQRVLKNTLYVLFACKEFRMNLMQLYVKIHLAYEYKYQNAKQLLYKTTIKKTCGFLICLTSLKNQLTKCFKKYVLFACKEF